MSMTTYERASTPVSTTTTALIAELARLRGLLREIRDSAKDRARLPHDRLRVILTLTEFALEPEHD